MSDPFECAVDFRSASSEISKMLRKTKILREMMRDTNKFAIQFGHDFIFRMLFPGCCLPLQDGSFCVLPIR